MQSSKSYFNIETALKEMEYDSKKKVNVEPIIEYEAPKQKQMHKGSVIRIESMPPVIADTG